MNITQLSVYMYLSLHYLYTCVFHSVTYIHVFITQLPVYMYVSLRCLYTCVFHPATCIHVCITTLPIYMCISLSYLYTCMYHYVTCIHVYFPRLPVYVYHPPSSGNDTLHVDGTPLMHQVAYQAAKKVSCENL